MSRYWSSVVHGLTPYVPGEQPKSTNLIKLNTNENPYGPSPKALEALKKELGSSLRLYPDPTAEALKRAIAEYYGLEAGQVFVGNGSDEVLAHTFQAFFKKEHPLLFPQITYSFYPVYCGLYEVTYKEIPLSGDFEILLKDYRQKNGGIIFPNPNAPTGRVVALEEIEALLQENRESVVVVDEAYIDFGGRSAASLIGRYPNLLVIQTFSKSRSLAGLRVGFALGPKELIEGLERIKNSFNSYPLDRFALAGAMAAIEDEEHFEWTRHAIIGIREQLRRDLERLNFEVLPSAANFLFVRHREKSGEELYGTLKERGILVRHFNHPPIEQFLRITVGRDEECRALIEELEKILD